MSEYRIIENEKSKVFRSKTFNYNFNKVTGYHAQWGRTYDEDTQRSPYGPVIADIEVVSMCKGPGVIAKGESKTLYFYRNVTGGKSGA